MSTFDFTAILDKTADEVAPPPTLPPGTYQWIGTSVKYPDAKAGSEWHRVVLNCKCLRAEEDVDPDLLEEFGDVTSAVNNVTFLFNAEEPHQQARTEVSLLRFLREHCEIAMDEGASLGQYLDAYPNSVFLGSVGWETDRDNPEIKYARIERTAPLGE